MQTKHFLRDKIVQAICPQLLSLNYIQAEIQLKRHLPVGLGLNSQSRSGRQRATKSFLLSNLQPTSIVREFSAHHHP
jgi:hypothetical protein